ncbi:MAG: DUF2150 family protein [Methanosarcinaceae archaeon]|nr:DUF2150 family protein [Methanosarcinaceae archaeon]
MAAKDSFYEYYTENRWKNWINQIKESKFELGDESETDVSIFVNMTDDVILACLKVIARFDKEALNAEEASEQIDKIQDIVMAEIPSISEDIDMMLYSVQDSLCCSFYAFQLYIAGEYSVDVDMESMIEEAFEADESEDYDKAFETVAYIGASVIAGAYFDENILANIPDERLELPTVNWLDGIDTISAAMAGTDSYKDFDEEDDEE